LKGAHNRIRNVGRRDESGNGNQNKDHDVFHHCLALVIRKDFAKAYFAMVAESSHSIFTRFLFAKHDIRNLQIKPRKIKISN